MGWLGRPTINAHLNLAFRCSADWNESKWCNAEFDTLLDQLDSTVELDKRLEISTQMADIMTNQGPEIIFGFPPVYRAYRDYVHGVVANPVSHTHLAAAWMSQT